MGALTYIPTEQAAEIAWQRYAVLVNAANADLRLWADRRHVEDMARAHRAFTEVFLALERAA